MLHFPKIFLEVGLLISGLHVLEIKDGSKTTALP